MVISRFCRRMVLFFVCSFFCGLNIFANKTINLTNLSTALNISSSVEYYETNDSKSSLNDILHKKFIAHSSDAVHFGFSNITRWFKITLISSKPSNWVFECGNPLIEYFDIFVPKAPNQFKLYRGGCFVAKNQRSYHSNFPVVNFALQPNKLQTLYIKITSQRGFYTKFQLIPSEVYETQSRTFDKVFWIFDGFQIFGNLIISITAFFLLRTYTYKIFAIYSLCILFTVLGYHESLGDFFTQNPICSSLINTLPYRLLAIPEIVFILCFLPINGIYPTWIKWYLYLMIATTFILAMGICFDYHWLWVKLNVVNTLLAEFSILLMLAYAYYKKATLEWFFVFAFIFSFLGFFMLQLRLLKIVDFGWINFVVFVSEPIKIIFFVLLLYQIFMRLQKEKVQAILLPKPALSSADVITKIPPNIPVVVEAPQIADDAVVSIKEESKINIADEAFLNRIEQIIESNLSNSAFVIDDLAAELNISSVQLRRKLKIITGQTTVEFIRNYRLKRAAELLKSRNGNVSDVAYQVGFESLSYFTKVFQEAYGKSPSEWLKS